MKIISRESSHRASSLIASTFQSKTRSNRKGQRPNRKKVERRAIVILMSKTRDSVGVFTSRAKATARRGHIHPIYQSRAYSKGGRCRYPPINH